MNKILVLDSSTIISLASNCMLWILKSLKAKSRTRFVISPIVKKETVNDAMSRPRWMFEGLRVNALINDGIIEVIDSVQYAKETEDIMYLANNTFFRGGEGIHIIDYGESEAIALANYLGAEVMGVDEKTLRLLIEDYRSLWGILEKKLHTRVTFHDSNYRKLMSIIRKKYIIRSTEIVSSAFQEGILQERIQPVKNERELIEGALWALKFSGCAISENEIKRYISSL